MESVKTALRVLELIAQSGSSGVSDLARALDEPKSTVQRNLVTLHEAGWIRPTEPGLRRRWMLTTKVLMVARQLQLAPYIRDAALPVMDRLRTRTGETIHLVLREGERAVLIERLDSPQPLRTVRPLGASAPLHLNSNGKAILANLPEPEQAAYLARPLEALTPKSISDPVALGLELERTRKRGYAVNDGELDPHIRAVAAPIRSAAGQVFASLSISCPAQRLPDTLIDAYGEMVRAAGAEISVAIARN